MATESKEFGTVGIEANYTLLGSAVGGSTRTAPGRRESRRPDIGPGVWLVYASISSSPSAFVIFWIISLLCSVAAPASPNATK